MEGNHIIKIIDSILPQTQCGQCSYTGCKPYADAISKGEADINQCPPGGEIVIRALAELMGVEYKPLDESYGISKPKAVAFIDEDTCIGCTQCVRACTTDVLEMVPWDGCKAGQIASSPRVEDCVGCKRCETACPTDFLSVRVYLGAETTRSLGLAY